MTAHTPEMSSELPCHRCGYDLRAHPADGKCPECGALVAEAKRLAAIPARPVWRDSDPCWRRRMVAGAWILVLMPLMQVLMMSEWASSVPIPNVFGFPVALYLDETLLSYMSVYESLIFCVGVVLLFSKEQGRSRNKLDWTCRWGILSSYVVFLLSAASVLFMGSLVLTGVAAVFQTIPLKYQPRITQLFAYAGTTYIRFGPQPSGNSHLALVAFSSIAILLACIPLFDALRSSGSKRLAVIFLAALALFSLIDLAHAGLYWFGFSAMTPADVYSSGIYFRPGLLLGDATFTTRAWSISLVSAIVIEGMKWCLVVAIALWLSIAQVAALKHNKGQKS